MGRLNAQPLTLRATEWEALKGSPTSLFRADSEAPQVRWSCEQMRNRKIKIQINEQDIIYIHRSRLYKIKVNTETNS